MKKMNKKLYLGAMILSLGMLLLAICAAVALAIAAMNQMVQLPTAITFGIQIFALGIFQFVVTNTFVTIFLIMRMWSVIQDGQARMTPGQAVGFLFVPFYNLYWIFQVWGGFQKDYNDYLNRYRMTVPPLPPGMYEAYPILSILCLIPFLGILVAPVGLFVFLSLISKTCDAVNNLLETDGQRRLTIPVSVQNPLMARS